MAFAREMLRQFANLLFSPTFHFVPLSDSINSPCYFTTFPVDTVWKQLAHKTVRCIVSNAIFQMWLFIVPVSRKSALLCKFYVAVLREYMKLWLKWP